MTFLCMVSLSPSADGDQWGHRGGEKSLHRESVAMFTWTQIMGINAWSNKNALCQHIIERFWSDTTHSERIFIQNERGGDHYSDWCSCARLFRLCLPGWAKIIPAAHICPMFPRWESSFRVPVCFPMNCISCHHGMDICIITIPLINASCSSCHATASFL